MKQQEALLQFVGKTVKIKLHKNSVVMVKACNQIKGFSFAHG